MATGTTTKNGAAAVEQPQQAAQQMTTQVRALPARIPYSSNVGKEFGVEPAAWKALVEAVFPLATSMDSIVMALSYCKARKLDPFKRVVHIVPIWSKELGKMVDTVWPGIGELRTTAFRTGCYAGRGQTVCGPDVTMKVGNQTITFPEWAQVTVRRLVKGVCVEFAGPRVYWLETYSQAARNDASPNAMWSKRPRGQLEKCAEAAALRAAFPEELGDEHSVEEVGIFQQQEARKILEAGTTPSGASSVSQRLADELAARRAEQETETTEEPEAEEDDEAEFAAEIKAAKSLGELELHLTDIAACLEKGKITIEAANRLSNLVEIHKAPFVGKK